MHIQSSQVISWNGDSKLLFSPKTLHIPWFNCVCHLSSTTTDKMYENCSFLLVSFDLIIASFNVCKYAQRLLHTSNFFEFKQWKVPFLPFLPKRLIGNVIDLQFKDVQLIYHSCETIEKTRYTSRHRKCCFIVIERLLH